MLGVLPPEIVLTVLNYIPLRQLQRLLGLSREWMNFFTANEPSIYHAAAVLHGFVSPYATLAQCKSLHGLWLADVHTWKTLCKTHYAMELRWEARGTVRYAAVSAACDTIHRFKVDTEQGTVITTYFEGGLRVSAIDTDVVLWSLPQSMVQPWAHCEYDGGYLVLTRLGYAMEVWRRKRDARVSPLPPSCQPDQRQERANSWSWQSPVSITQNDRGTFVPWTVIVPPNPVLASRLVFPTLLLASPSANEAYIYDIVTGTLMQVVSLRDLHGSINYVELGVRHIFVCTETDILIIPRDPEYSRNVFKFPSQMENFHGLYAYSVDEPQGEDLLELERPSLVLEECSLRFRDAIPNPVQSRYREVYHNFSAVHVSPCGSHFVACDKQGFLYLVRDFEQAIHEARSLAFCVIIVDLVYPITYLALHEDKRACVHVHRRGVYVVPFLSVENAVSTDTLDMLPYKVHPRLFYAKHAGSYGPSPCIQMTRTGLWTKQTIGIGLPGRNKLRYLDFTESQ